MKQFLLTSTIGHWALVLRDKAELFSVALRKPEAVGTLANDQMATFLVTRLCQPGTIFVDVGAHIGSIVGEVGRQCQPKEIHAIEAIPHKARNLQRSFRGVMVHQCAVGDHEGEVTFYENTKQSGYSSLIKPVGNQHSLCELKVPLRKLDDLVSHVGVDVIKIDVEGAELDVLNGAVKLIATSRPVVLFESAPGDEQIKTQLLRYFEEREYAVLAPNRLAHNDAGFNLSTFLEGHLYPRRTTNYFAVPRERRLEVRDRARQLLSIA